MANPVLAQLERMFPFVEKRVLERYYEVESGVVELDNPNWLTNLLLLEILNKVSRIENRVAT